MGRHIAHPDSLESIYRNYASRVRWVLRSHGIREPVLDDLVHDVFLAIHRRLPTRDPSISLGMWIVGVTRNVAFSHRRASARTSLRERDLPAPQPGLAPDEAVARRQAWASFDAFLGGLKPPQREVFVLVDVLGMSSVEVARSTGAETNTVYSRLRLARRKFKEHFATLENDEARAAFLERAQKQGRAPADERRRTWAAIAAEVATLPTASSPLLAKLGLAFLGAGIATGVVWVALPDETPRAVVPLRALGGLPFTVSSSRHQGVPTSPPTPTAQPVVDPTPAEPIEPPEAAPAKAPVERRKRATPRPTPKENITEQLERLRGIKRTLNHGKAAKALQMVDRFVDDYPRTTFEVEMRRLARAAACALGRTQRAKDEADRLQELGAAAPTGGCKGNERPDDGSG